MKVERSESRHEDEIGLACLRVSKPVTTSWDVPWRESEQSSNHVLILCKVSLLKQRVVSTGANTSRWPPIHWPDTKS